MIIQLFYLFTIFYSQYSIHNILSDKYFPDRRYPPIRKINLVFYSLYPGFSAKLGFFPVLFNVMGK